jgi:hypothetical protein
MRWCRTVKTGRLYGRRELAGGALAYGVLTQPQFFLLIFQLDSKLVGPVGGITRWALLGNWEKPAKKHLIFFLLELPLSCKKLTDN